MAGFHLQIDLKTYNSLSGFWLFTLDVERTSVFEDRKQTMEFYALYLTILFILDMPLLGLKIQTL